MHLHYILWRPGAPCFVLVLQCKACVGDQSHTTNGHAKLQANLVTGGCLLPKFYLLPTRRRSLEYIYIYKYRFLEYSSLEYIFIYSPGSPSRSRRGAQRVFATSSFSWYPTAPLFIRRASLVLLFTFQLVPDGASLLVCASCLLRATRGLQRKFELCKKNL